MEWLTVTLAMVGKLAITASYGAVYIFSTEQFPTVIRNAGLGAGSTCARIGSITSPYINVLVSMLILKKKTIIINFVMISRVYIGAHYR